MATRMETLVDDARFYAEQLDRIGSVLVDLIRTKTPYRNLIDETSEAYRLLTMDLVEIYALFKRTYRHEHSLGAKRQEPEGTFEALEEMFVIYRDAAEAAESRAGKVSRYHSKETRKLKATAETLVSLAENAAKMLLTVGHRLKVWADDEEEARWERDIGIRRWLR